MVRPRKPSDPDVWPIPCTRCGGHYPIAAKWPDGPVCTYCYQQAKRTRGTCGCGHTGVLPGVLDGRPACRRCSGIALNLDCRICGAEDELYRGGRCQRCELAVLVDHLLTDPQSGTIAAELVPVAAALKVMARPNSGITWIRQRHVTAFLADLSSAPTITHDSLDALPASRTRDYVRALLVEHGVLLQRDETRLRYRQWATEALDRVHHPAMREIIDRYVRWHLLRRMNQSETVSHGTFLRSKQTVSVAIDFVNWLGTEGLELGDLRQGHLDHWIATGPTTRLIVDRFLGWATASRLVAPELTVPKHRRGTSRRLSAAEQDHALQIAVHTDVLSSRDRALAILVLVFAQQIENIVRLRWDDVTITDDQVTIRLADLEIALPEPLDQPWRDLAVNPGHDQTAAHPRSNWVFRGYTPGRHLDPAAARDRLGRTFSARAARLGTLEHLSKLAPVAIIAETLGYHPATIERHAAASSAGYAEYIAAINDAQTDLAIDSP
ncbi:hypothetical protein RR21198_0318 [Rhodococcus rhodochrous ATCC 21198]|uniref:hypothetical protein n=1 Tax=Rhodococcus aetherivorans TaxID=191292 RepID=UPI0003E25A31|nr:hypothetical protein [Rhodococcus aetherivorans]ETT24131.1 hypothetical protein RR21198_0318 [Rhodococcus rhodochrous ATCC 21198]NGP28909.1 Fis family transcriptional regulator [Rhodococcus aetherivorans]